MNAAAQGNTRGRARPQKPLTREKVEALVGVHPNEFWIRFWQGVDQETWKSKSSCLLWTGRTGLVSFPKGVRLPAAHVAWAYTRKELPAGARLVPSCGQSRCVQVSHLTVRGEG